MSLSDDVAITALVISLVALVVGSSQFLQAILGTAEGYRRCSSSVIGPWSKLRRRIFQWSEFRFETRYVVPTISLVSMQHLDEETSVKHLRYGEHSGHACDVARLAQDPITLLIHRRRVSLKSRANSLLTYLFPWRSDPTDVLLESLHMPELQQQDIYVSTKLDPEAGQELYPGEPERSRASMIRHSINLEEYSGEDSQPVRQQDTRQVRDTFNVTWIRLLRELHILYQYYTPHRSCYCCRSLQGSAIAQSRPYDEQYESTVIVTPTTETWDFMPPDVSRPMALSTVGHMTVLVLRLGMQWRLLDRGRLQMNADGNGFSISSTEVKGLGMTFRLNVFGRAHYSHPIVPSRAADKLMCGVIPGDPMLVRTDFTLIGHDRALVQLWQSGGVYYRLGLDPGTISLLRDQDRWTTHNEVVTALCSFVPLRSSFANAFFFSGWKKRQYSAFHFFEPRLAFLDTLLGRSNISPDLAFVRDYLRSLAEVFPVEYFAGCTKRLSKEPDQQKRTIELTHACHEIFSKTTAWFEHHNYHNKNGSDKTWYMQLVAAHARLSAHVNSTSDSIQGLTQAVILENHRELLDARDIQTTYFAEHLWLQTQGYIRDLDHIDYGVPQYMMERSFPGKRDDIMTAWWMMILRGIVWDLSCKCMPYPGEPVPSSYYYDETTVWIT